MDRENRTFVMKDSPGHKQRENHGGRPSGKDLIHLNIYLLQVILPYLYFLKMN